MLPEEMDIINPFEQKTKEAIYADLEESRACYERGEYEEFDSALDDICTRYDL